MQTNELPVAVIGGGPVGLAAAAHLLERGLRPVVFEAGPRVGHAMRDWGHVRVFSPWRYVVDHASKRMLAESGWGMPDEEALPTGRELVEQYLDPLAALPAIGATLQLGTRVAAVSRQFVDKVKTPDRDAMPFVVRTIDADGVEHDVLARAVIDASGTWFKPNPMGANGLPARGETAHAAQIRYGIPDILGRERARYTGKRTLVVGTGHSAVNSLLALVELMDAGDGTRVFWGMRRSAPGNAFGGGNDDALPARGALGTRLRAQVDAGNVRILPGLQIGAIQECDGTLVISDVNGNEVALVDEVIVATGMRPESRAPPRNAARPQRGAGEPARPRAADRPERAQLRVGAAARRIRAGAAGARPVHRRDEELRASADLSARHGIRAGAIGRGIPRRRLRRGTRSPARAGPGGASAPAVVASCCGS